MTYQVPQINTSVRTWTPIIKFGGASVGLTYTIQQGWYSIEGGILYLTGTLVINSMGSSTGLATIGGLPINIKSTLSVIDSMYFTPIFNNVIITANNYPITLYDSTNHVFNLQQSAGGIPISLNNTNFTTGSEISLTTLYPI
jgi:hypothetical protein